MMKRPTPVLPCVAKDNVEICPTAIKLGATCFNSSKFEVLKLSSSFARSFVPRPACLTKGLVWVDAWVDVVTPSVETTQLFLSVEL
jgi:hypothetical protein